MRVWANKMQTLNDGQNKPAPVRVLLADDSDLIRQAIRVLGLEPSVLVVGEAENFAQTFELCNSLKPNVVVLDLHMRDESKFTAEFIKSELLNCAEHILAISVWNDDVAKDLASSYGAFALLDKSALGQC
jgi:DNA-binding NarL/FixJ family response regulator